jgi:hypothetical protein
MVGAPQHKMQIDYWLDVRNFAGLEEGYCLAIKYKKFNNLTA